MGFTVSSLSNYTNEQNLKMYMPSLFKGKTAKYANVQTGIKSAEKIKLLDTTVFMQAGGTCTEFNSSGATTISDRTLTVGKLKIENSWCIPELEAKSTQLLLKKGSNYTEADLPKEVLDILIGRLMEKLETADWQGDLLSGNPNINKYDGIHTLMVAAGTGLEANVAAYIAAVLTGTPTAANVISVFNAIRLAQTDLLPGLRNVGNNLLFVDPLWSELYLIANQTANQFHYNGMGNQQNDETIKIFGTNITIVPTEGLSGIDAGYLIHEDNLFLGTDLENEEEKIKLWYDDEDEKVKSRILFKRGWQILRPAEVIEFTF
jgi:hypothetical protein